MNNINLSDITFNSDKVLNNLHGYLCKIFTYKNFDQGLELRVFVDSKKDFCAFEALKKNLVFMSSEHKFEDLIFSNIEPLEIDFKSFLQFVSSKK